MDYRIKKENKIVYGIFNNIENQYSESSKETAKNISDYFLSKLLLKSHDILIDDTTDKLIERAAEDNFYTHIVVMITGTHIGLSDRLFGYIEEKCTEHFTIAGHILDRGDAYYEIHNQFFILNLEEFRRIGSPKMGDLDWHKEHSKIQPIRSKECVNEDLEIPVWVKQGTVERTYLQQRHGWNFVDVGLKNDALFTDVGDSIRQHKEYLYYEYDHVFLRHVTSLFNYTLICNTVVAPWNSDGLSQEIKIDNPIDHYVSTGTGLNWLFNLNKLNYHPNTKITFYDVSYSVLTFMKSLIDEWDGTDYPSFYINHLTFIPDNFDHDLKTLEESTRDWWEDFESKFDNFQELWNDIKKLNFDYRLMDLFASNNYNFIVPGETTFFNASDVFNHVPYVNTATVKFRVARENNLINTLKNIDENIFLYIPTRLGSIFTDNQGIRFGNVKDFNLWNINEFNTPPWHKNDWKSYCPMTNSEKILT